MGRVVVTENVSLDGVVQDPTGEEGSRHGGWFARIGDTDREERARVMLDEAMGAAAFLLGRRSYEFLAARWPSRTGELADRLKPAQVRRVVDPEGSRLDELHDAGGRRREPGLELRQELEGTSSSRPAGSSCAR